MVTIAKDFTVVLDNKPGRLWKATDALAKAGVNIDGFSGSAECGNTFHFLFTADASGAKRALEGVGLKVKTERDVLLVDVEDRPGAAAKIFKEIADRELNADLVYLATETRIVVGGDEIQQIRESLQTLSTAAR
jgi:hypothetical protein